MTDYLWLDIPLIGALLISFYVLLLLFRRGQTSFAIILVLIIAVALRLVITSDPYLHIYDERYHALIAANLSNNLWKPVLYAHPILPYDHTDWWSNHVWLSKPPLPMMVMAASIQFFGKTLFAIRLPSIVFGVLSVFFTFKIGKRLFDTEIGVIASFLHAIHGMMLELTGGRMSSDHVDIAFLFFAQLFVYLMLFYATMWSRILAGVILACCFLSKWTFVLLPISLITVVFLVSPKVVVRKNIHFTITSFLVISGLWLSHLHLSYPTELYHTIQAVLAVASDITSPHVAGGFYYIDQLRIVFGELIYIPLIYLLIKVPYLIKSNNQLFFCLLWVIIPLILLSLSIVKRSNYMLFVAAALFIITAYAFQKCWSYNNENPVSAYFVKLIGILLIALPMRYTAERMKVGRPHDHERLRSIEVSTIDVSEVDIERAVLLSEEFPIEVMFYTGIISYGTPVTDSLVTMLNDRGYDVYLRSGSQLRSISN